MEAVTLSMGQIYVHQSCDGIFFCFFLNIFENVRKFSWMILLYHIYFYFFYFYFYIFFFVLFYILYQLYVMYFCTLFTHLNREMCFWRGLWAPKCFIQIWSAFQNWSPNAHFGDHSVFFSLVCQRLRPYYICTTA